MIECKECGCPYHEGMANCPECGTPTEYSVNTTNMANCPNCGAPLTNSVACDYCGITLPKSPIPNKVQTAYNSSQNNYSQYVSNSSKDKTTAALLALLLGGLGIHYFYLNKPIAGLIFLLLCWTWIPMIVALAQGIMMLTMTEEQFNVKYVDNDDTVPLF